MKIECFMFTRIERSFTEQIIEVMFIRRYFCNVARTQAARINHLEQSLKCAEVRLHKTNAELKHSEHKIKKLRTASIHAVTILEKIFNINTLRTERERKCNLYIGKCSCIVIKKFKNAIK